MAHHYFSKPALSLKERKDIQEAYTIIGVTEDISGDTLSKFIERKRERIKFLGEKEYLPQIIKDKLNKLLNNW